MKKIQSGQIQDGFGEMQRRNSGHDQDHHALPLISTNELPRSLAVHRRRLYSECLHTLLVDVGLPLIRRRVPQFQVVGRGESGS